jgi:hypothetical protein
MSQARRIFTMNRIKSIAGVLIGAAVVGAPAIARAETCSYLPGADQGDDYHMDRWACSQAHINWWWDAFTFQTDYWDDGMGWEDPCNNNKPLARMFNALYALGYSSTSSPTCSTSNDNMTLWAMCWSGNQIKRTRAQCGSGSKEGTPASTYLGPTATDRTEFKWPFFYGESIANRAAIIVHEARHADGCRHNGGDDCEWGSSCDKSWADGCNDLGSQHGSNRWQASYLSWYVGTAWRTTVALRLSALIVANDILDRGFKDEPCLNMTASGSVVSC